MGCRRARTRRRHYEDCKAELVHYDPQAESKLVAALLYRFSGGSYDEIWQRVEAMTPD